MANTYSDLILNSGQHECPSPDSAVSLAKQKISSHERLVYSLQRRRTDGDVNEPTTPRAAPTQPHHKQKDKRSLVPVKRFSSMSEKELASVFYQYGVKVKRKASRSTSTGTGGRLGSPESTPTQIDVLEVDPDIITHPPGIYIKQEPGNFTYRLNRTSKLRAAYLRGLKLSEVDKAEFAKLPSMRSTRMPTATPQEVQTPPARARLSLAVPEQPVRFNRTSKMRYMYNHLPPPIRTRHGVFEVSSDGRSSDGTISKTGTIDGIRYVIEDIKYDYTAYNDPNRRTRRKRTSSIASSASSPPPPPRTPKSSRSTVSSKRDNDLRLRQRRELRIQREKRLPFK